MASGFQFIGPLTFSLESVRALMNGSEMNVTVSIIDHGVNVIGTVGGGTGLQVGSFGQRSPGLRDRARGR